MQSNYTQSETESQISDQKLTLEVFPDGPLNEQDLIWDYLEDKTFEQAVSLDEIKSRSLQRIQQEFDLLDSLQWGDYRNCNIREQSNYENCSFHCSRMQSIFQEKDHNHIIASSGLQSKQEITDFYKLVCEQNITRVVAMNNKMEEKASGWFTECLRYFPISKDEPMKLGHLTITLVSEELSQNLDTRVIQIADSTNDVVRQFTHIHYKAWEDFGQPAQSSIKQFLPIIIDNAKFIVKQQQTLLEGKEEPERLFVHCRQGIGRTGTTLALTNLAIQLVVAGKNKECDQAKFSPSSVVRRLRLQRFNQCETEEQYQFLYKFLNAIKPKKQS